MEEAELTSAGHREKGGILAQPARLML